MRPAPPLSMAALAACALPAGPACAQEDVAARIQALETQLRAMSEELARLKAQTITATQATQAPQAGPVQASAPPAPSIAAPSRPAPAPAAAQASLDNGRPMLRTADGRFSAAVRSVMQLDVGAYFQSDDLPPQVSARDLSNGANLRRARIGVEGRLYGDFDYNILLDFGGSGAEDTGRIQDLWIQYSGLKAATLRIGAFAPSVGLDDSTSTSGMPFTERAAAADLARNIAAGDTRMSVGAISAHDRWFASAALTGSFLSSINAGATDFNRPTFDEQTGYALRLAGSPFLTSDSRLHLGVNASVMVNPADEGLARNPRYPVRLRERPELRVDGERLVDTGAIDATGASALGVEAAYQRRNLLLQAEYFDFRVDRRNPGAGVSDPRFSGWYVAGVWGLTGDARRYNTAVASFDAPAVARPFAPSRGTFGAVELAARYSRLDLNYETDSTVLLERVRGGEQSIWSLGLNWYPNRTVKFMLDLQDVSISRQTSTGLPLDQDFRTVNLRSQFAF